MNNIGMDKAASKIFSNPLWPIVTLFRNCSDDKVAHIPISDLNVFVMFLNKTNKQTNKQTPRDHAPLQQLSKL